MVDIQVFAWKSGGSGNETGKISLVVTGARMVIPFLTVIVIVWRSLWFYLITIFLPFEM